MIISLHDKEAFMITNLKIKKILLIITLVALLFAPFIKVYDIQYSIIDTLFAGKNTAIIVFSYIFIFISIIVILFKDYLLNKKISLILNCLLLLSIILLFIFENLNFGVPQKNVQIESGFSAFIIFFISVIYLDFNSIKGDFSLTVRDLVEIAVFTSLAIVFDMSIFKLRVGQNGGSISIAMLPLFIICLRKGFLKGFFACGIIYALFSCLLDGYGFISFPFDYLLGFGSIAILGLFKNLIFNQKKVTLKIIFLVIGVVLSLVFRLTFATISGIIFYSLSFVPSLVYQIGYILPSGGICLALLLVLLKPISTLQKKQF